MVAKLDSVTMKWWH